MVKSVWLPSGYALSHPPSKTRPAPSLTIESPDRIGRAASNRPGTRLFEPGGIRLTVALVPWFRPGVPEPRPVHGTRRLIDDLIAKPYRVRLTEAGGWART